MDPSNSRSGPRYVGANKNNFLNSIYSKEEKRASREFTGWYSLSQRCNTSGGQQQGQRSSKSATRLGFGETNVTLQRTRQRPRSSAGIPPPQQHKPALGLMFTVQPQLANLHAPKRFNLGPPVSLSSSSQFSLLLRSNPINTAANKASPDRKKLSRWRQELQRELQRVDTQIHRHDTARSTVPSSPPAGNAGNAGNGAMASGPTAIDFTTATLTSTQQYTHVPGTPRLEVPQTDDALGSTEQWNTTLASSDTATNHNVPADAEGTDTNIELKPEPEPTKDTLTHNTLANPVNSANASNPIATSPPATMFHNSLTSPLNNTLLKSNQDNAGTSTKDASVSTQIPAHRQRPQSARHQRPASPHRANKSDTATHNPVMASASIKSARFMARPASARSSRQRTRRSSHSSRNINASTAVGSARKAIQARRGRPQSAASIRSASNSNFASTAYASQEQPTTQQTPQHTGSGVAAAPRFGADANAMVSVSTLSARGGTTSQRKQLVPRQSTGNLYRRAPSSRGGSFDPQSLGSGLWYVWDPKRKRGTMRGYKSLPRNAGFKSNFTTTTKSNFGRANNTKLSSPKFGRKKSCLR